MIAPAWTLEPAPKVHGTERTVTLADTSQRVAKVMSLVPITRVNDVTPLDTLGLPTFCAVTPLAADLTTHMGKGRNELSARLSAVMEAVERVSAESTWQQRVRVASYSDLLLDDTVEPIDPIDFTLPDDTAYSPVAPIGWVSTRDLVTGRSKWIPRDLVVNPPTEGVLRDVDTNGLAAGNTVLEAATHGICEVIERDVWSQHEFRIEFAGDDQPMPKPRRIDPRSLPDEPRSWTERIRESGLDVVVHDLTDALGVTTIQAIITDHRFPTTSGSQRLHFQGLGTHPNATTAVSRAITEAVQGRLSVIQGARDDYNTIPATERSTTRRRRAVHVSAGAEIGFDDVVSVRNDDVRDDLEFLIDRVVGAGFRSILVADLTRPDLAIPVVRVRIPGMSSFVVNRRRVGWRCLRHLL